jgi:cystathionine beta-lyase
MKAKKPSRTRSYKPATTLVLAGRTPFDYEGFVNTPIFRGSTVLWETYDALIEHRGKYTYGRRGTPTTEALSVALTELEGSAGVLLTPSGLSAITTALLAILESGDHLLLSDTVYNPTRVFAGKILKKFGVEVEYFDPLLGTKLETLFRKNTRAIFLEAPGSQSFEMQDIPAIAKLARKRGIISLMDNTWATPLFFRPHEFGVDISLQAGTKYYGGHADINLGTISATKEWFGKLKDAHGNLGINPGPEDVFLALRGLRTLAVRMERHQTSALQIARWLQRRPEILRVLHPALPSDPGHKLWKRDFKGASGLFSFILKPVPKKKLAAFFDSLTLFGMGYSWGGFESLAIPFDCSRYRTATKWNPGGPAVRIHIGLEDPADLMADLANALGKLR